MKNSVIVSMLRKLICCVFLLWVELTTTACLIIFIASETSGKYSQRNKSFIKTALFNRFNRISGLRGSPRYNNYRPVNRRRKWLTVNRFKQYKINLIQDGSKKSQFIVNIYSFCIFEKRNIISNGFIINHLYLSSINWPTFESGRSKWPMSRWPGSIIQ